MGELLGPYKRDPLFFHGTESQQIRFHERSKLAGNKRSNQKFNSKRKP
jgi:hypothetical protein